ncbi:bacteriochlorophyll 4-vinyl reductase [Rhodobacter sp. Har01]|uniref:bacteriochlorophyll 4-vinyl reductase n=1 Tax=Rhodobacter sp. Har01 TaxID=2883999 RepID=UPI001D085DC0|nr:bacteriochlorophyll 4-vinyl reductase [Rhodobacter sp. Har01]MCB6176812.1 bacteriochlorophyll 4-vinyl reductase [Rhodobacter sp. Har01]
MDGSRVFEPRDGSARIGPNAILQTIAVLDHCEGRAIRDRVMAVADVAVPPPDAGMLPEADCRAVHEAVRSVTGDRAEGLLRLAGLATGDYILQNRIPAPARALIRVLPGYIGAWVLAKAIAKHSWTFAGSGKFRIASHLPVVFELENNPLAPVFSDHPACTWHVAVFERLFARLVWPSVVVEEADCAAMGARVCRFVLHPYGMSRRGRAAGD